MSLAVVCARGKVALPKKTPKRDPDAIRDYKSSDQFVLRRIEKFGKLSRSAERALIEQWKSDNSDQKALRAIFRHNQRLVAKIAFQYLNRGLELCELIQEGNVGMYRALVKFKPETGNKFSTCATWWIREGIDRAVKNKGRMIRIPVNAMQTMNAIKKQMDENRDDGSLPMNRKQLAEHFKVGRDEIERHLSYLSLPISLDVPQQRYHPGNASTMCDSLSDVEEKQPEEQIERKSDYEQLRSWVDLLPRRDKLFISKMFGLADGHPRTRAQMAALYKTKEQDIHKREKQIISKLKSISDGHIINGDYSAKPKELVWSKPDPMQYNYGESIIKVELYCAGRTAKTYDVFLESGDWPADVTLINFCDGGNPFCQTHGGGLVAAGDEENHKVVTVFRKASGGELSGT